MPIVRIGRSVFVKAVDLANFLETGLRRGVVGTSVTGPVQVSRRLGRPRKYTEVARVLAASARKMKGGQNG